MTQNNDQPKSIFSGVFTGYLILILHLALIVALTATVVFLKSLYDIRWLLLTAGLILIAGSAGYFYQRIKKSNRKLADILNSPALQGRSVEISLLGGMATFKLGNTSSVTPRQILIDEHGNDVKQLEMTQPSRLSNLSELKKLLDGDLITKEEFFRLKGEIMSASATPHSAKTENDYMVIEDKIRNS